jgi:nitrite reductase/ring-hydroxylating ferredoxin subunit
MSDDGWHKLEGISVSTEKFPARTKIAGEGVLVFRTKTGYRGTERACPHLKATLTDAVLMAGDTVLRCALHNFTFKLSDGRGVNSPAFRLRVFEVKIEDDVFFGRWAGQPATTDAVKP